MEEKIPTGAKVLIHYSKAPGFRTIHADGVFGGSSPNGTNLNIGFFSERASFPDMVAHEVEEGGRVNTGREVQRINSRPGVMREIDVNVVMSVEAAKVLRAWLDHHIQGAEEHLSRGPGMGIEQDGVVPPQRGGS